VTAATDVTGFGLLGHLRHVVDGSRLVRRSHAAVPLLPGALGRTRRARSRGFNATSATSRLACAAPAHRSDLLTLLCDAQTSGGLLLCVPPEHTDALLSELGAGAALIGELVDGDPGTLKLEP
jgi:selenide,water dikinase